MGTFNRTIVLAALAASSACLVPPSRADETPQPPPDYDTNIIFKTKHGPGALHSGGGSEDPAPTRSAHSESTTGSGTGTGTDPLSAPGHTDPSHHGSGTAGAGGGGGSGRVAVFSNQGQIVSLLRKLKSDTGDMIHDCVGRPVANNFLIRAVRMMQSYDKRWGFMKKSGGRIPRDILAYGLEANPQNGTQKAVIIDFISSSCDNNPSSPDFAKPAPQADIWWNVLNDGFIDNGVWSKDP